MFQIDKERGLILDERDMPVSAEQARAIIAACKEHLKWGRDEKELLVRRMLDEMPGGSQVNIEAFL